MIFLFSFMDAGRRLSLVVIRRRLKMRLHGHFFIQVLRTWLFRFPSSFFLSFCLPAICSSMTCQCSHSKSYSSFDIYISLRQVDNEKTVGPEAFARIAPACAAVADIITVHNLFDALTSSSGYRLHFLVYDKYLRSLDK